MPITSSPRSIRPLFLLFLGPLLQNAIFMTWANLMTFKASKLGYTADKLCYIGICMALGYTISSWIAGRWVTVKTAAPVFATATVGSALLGLPIVWLPPFLPYLGLGFIFGLVNGHYFCPFQIGMGSVKPFRTLAWTIAAYNISWGTGVAIGPYLAGILAGLPSDENGLPPKTPFLILAAAFAIVHTTLVLLAQSAPRPDPAVPTEPAERAEALFPSTRRLRILGNICSLVGQFILQSLAMSLWAPLAEAEHLDSYQKGLALAVLGLQIPIGAVVFATQRARMTRPWMLMALLVAAALTFPLLPLVTVWPWHLVVMAAIGFASSGLFFHGVYYPNADPDNPQRSVALMETCVGIAGFSGPLIMGTLAGGRETAFWPYLVGSVLILGAAVIALKVWLNGEDPLPTAGKSENLPQIDADLR